MTNIMANFFSKNTNSKQIEALGKQRQDTMRSAQSYADQITEAVNIIDELDRLTDRPFVEPNEYEHIQITFPVVDIGHNHLGIIHLVYLNGEVEPLCARFIHSESPA